MIIWGVFKWEKMTIWKLPGIYLRTLLKMNMSKEIILKISQKIDEYVFDYYVSNENIKKQE